MSEKCSATARTGSRCGNWAIPGASVCRMHGGAAPQVRQAAKVRAASLQAHHVAERMVARAGVGVDPIEHLLESLHRSAALVEVWGVMVAELDARAEAWADTHGTHRGEIGYRSTGPESPDELEVASRDALIVLNRSGMGTVHPFVAEYTLALERRARFAKLCIDAGVAERQVRIAEQQGALLAQVIRGILTDLGVQDRPEVPAIVRRHLTLVSGQQRAA